MSNNLNGGGRGRNALSSVDFYRRVPKDLTEVRQKIVARCLCVREQRREWSLVCPSSRFWYKTLVHSTEWLVERLFFCGRFFFFENANPSSDMQRRLLCMSSPPSVFSHRSTPLLSTMLLRLLLYSARQRHWARPCRLWR